MCNFFIKYFFLRNELKIKWILLKIGINACSIHIFVFLCVAQAFIPVKRKTYPN